MVETYFSLPFTVMSLNSHKTYEDWKKAVANGTLERDFEEGMNKYLDSAYLLIFNGNSSSKLVIGSNFRDMKTGPRCGANERHIFLISKRNMRGFL